MVSAALGPSAGAAQWLRQESPTSGVPSTLLSFKDALISSILNACFESRSWVLLHHGQNRPRFLSTPSNGTTTNTQCVHWSAVEDRNAPALWGCSGSTATLWLDTNTTVFSLWVCAMNFVLLKAKCTWGSYGSPKSAWGLDFLPTFERWPVSLFSFRFSFKYLGQWAVGTTLIQYMF